MAKARIHRCQEDCPLVHEQDLNRLADVLRDIVHGGEGSWRERKDYILSQLSDETKGQLEEFVGWFEGDFE